jgi:hypothetical protein
MTQNIWKQEELIVSHCLGTYLRYFLLYVILGKPSCTSSLLQVIHTAEKLLESIQLAMKGKEEEDQLIAPSFLDMAEELRAVYDCYCMSHENALALLDKVCITPHSIFKLSYNTLVS